MIDIRLLTILLLDAGLLILISGFSFWGLVYYFLAFMVLQFLGLLTVGFLPDVEETWVRKDQGFIFDRYSLYLMLICGGSAAAAAMALSPKSILESTFDAFRFALLLNASSTVGFFLPNFVLEFKKAKILFKKIIMTCLYLDIFFAAFAGLSYQALS